MTIVRKMASNEIGITPLYALTGMTLTQGDEGLCVTELVPSEWLSDTAGFVSRGIVASGMSVNLAGAALTLSPGGRFVGVIDQHLSVLRDVPTDAGRLLLRASVISRSDEFIVSSAEATDDDGNHVAVGYQTAVLRERPQRIAPPESKRTLTTVLFTDIVDSTPTAERLGDAGWQSLVGEHNAIVRKELKSFRGREVKTMGDGFLAVFDSPARALHCARAVRDGVRRLGIEIRAGLHTGECDLVGDDVSGVAVAIGARIQSAAGPNEILVSGTVRELVVGSGIQFLDHGVHNLKGVEGEWHLFAVNS